MSQRESVSREEYAAYSNALIANGCTDHPVEGTDICAMQTVDSNNNVLAQAVYQHGIATYYINGIGNEPV